MRSWITRMLVGTVTLAAVAAGPATSALARPHHHAHTRVVRSVKADPAGSENTGEGPAAGESPAAGEADNDAAQQAAACSKAGIDPNAANVQYDGQTGTCSIDNGNSQQQQ